MVALRDDLLQPIDGDNPAGVYLRWDPADTTYDAIKDARTEEEDLPRGDWQPERKTANWDVVVSLAGDSLATRSKDLQLAAWLTEALLHRDGVAGLARGLDILRALLEDFWDSVYPELEEDGNADLRVAPVAWVGGRLGEAVSAVRLNGAGHTLLEYKQARGLGYEKEVADDPKRAEARQQAIAEGRLSPESFDESFDATPKSFYKELVADQAASVAAVEALESVSDEKFADDPPTFRPLKEALEDLGRVTRQLLERKLEQDPDPPGEEPLETAAVTDPAATDDKAAAGGPAAAPAGAEPRNVREAAAAIAAAARYLRRATPTDPAPYALLRGYRWGELRSDGALDPKMLEAPPTETRTRLKGLLLDSKWSDLLDAGEEVMATPFGRGWLDLQRYVVTACSGLGGEYDGVAATILAALQDLLRRRPELPDLTLMDDSPTANRETRQWLSEQGLMELEGEPAPTPRGRVAADRDVSTLAMERVRARKPQEGIRLLMAALDQEKSDRARFLRRSEITRIMVESGMHEVARPILQQMLQKIEDHRLESWEAGETVALPLALLYRCLEATGEDAGRQELYQRVCRLDPVQAMGFGQPADASDGHGQGDGAAPGQVPVAAAADGDPATEAEATSGDGIDDE